MMPSDTANASFADEWWRRVRAGESVVQKCEACAALQLYPRRRCVKCGSGRLAITAVSGRGILYTFTTVYRNAPSDFNSQLPYALGVVLLDEGPRMLTRMVNCNIETLACDMRVRWTLARIGEREMPCFEPVSA